MWKNRFVTRLSLFSFTFTNYIQFSDFMRALEMISQPSQYPLRIFTYFYSCFWHILHLDKYTNICHWVQHWPQWGPPYWLILIFATRCSNDHDRSCTGTAISANCLGKGYANWALVSFRGGGSSTSMTTPEMTTPWPNKPLCSLQGVWLKNPLSLPYSEWT